MEVEIQLLKKDMDYLKSEIGEIKTLLRQVIETKADKEEVARLRDNQNKVVWLVISAVILAVMGLVIKSTI